MIRRRRRGLRRNANPNFMIQPQGVQRYTGLAGPRQSVRRTATPAPTSSSTEVPEQQQGGGLLEQAIQMKGAYEGVQDSVEGGKKAGDFIRNFPEKLDAYGNSVSEVLGLQHTKNGNIVNASNPPLERAQNAYNGLIGKQQHAISDTYGHTGGTALPNASGPTDAGFNALARTDMVPKAGEFQFGASQVGSGATNASTGANTGLKASTKAATGGPSMLGAAGGALGVGLNAMDIAENGANFGNVAGTIGSAALGGAALAGPAMAAALGPVGWAALGASFISSFF